MDESQDDKADVISCCITGLSHMPWLITAWDLCDNDNDAASNPCVLWLVGMGILPQPSSYKRLTRLYLERRAIQLGCNAGMAIRLPLPLGGKVLARCPGTRLYTSLKTNFVNEV